MHPTLARVVLLSTVALAAACVDDPDADAALGVDEAALTGAATAARPGVGRVHRDGTTASCAATLVAPQLVVTGDACIGGRTSATPFAKHVTQYQRHLEGQIERSWSPHVYGWDRPGMDFRTITDSVWAIGEFACAGYCTADTRCRAWTLNVDTNTCYLKDGVPPLRPSVAGAVTGRPSSPYAARFDGNDLTSLTTARIEQCAQACGANPQCVAYSWERPTGFCVLKGAIGTTVNSSTWESGIVVRAEVGYDRPGSDYAVDTVADRPACTQLCAGDARCLAFTFVESSRACWRKDGVPWPSRTTGMQSGRKLGMNFNVDYVGGDLRTFTTTATDPASTCQAACARDAQCKAWALSEATSDPTCHLKSSIAAPSFKARVVSGLKGLEFTGGIAR